LVEISAKNDKFRYLNILLGQLGVTSDLCRWLVGKPMVTFY